MKVRSIKFIAYFLNMKNKLSLSLIYRFCSEYCFKKLRFSQINFRPILLYMFKYNNNYWRKLFMIRI